MANERTIKRPYKKMNRLLAEAKARGGAIGTYAALAKAIGVTAGRITQMFGYGQESSGTVVKAETVGAIVKAFRDDGVPLDIDWLYLEYEEFARRLSQAGSNAPPAEPPAAEWQRRRGTVLADLVMLRLDPPRPGNEPQNSYYVEATLRFGTAKVDVDPETDADDARTLAIALTEARLAVDSDSWEPLPGTMLGERDGTQSPHYTHRGNAIDIIGPAPAGTLDGDPLAGQHLAVIAGTNVGDDEFAVSVAALRGSFVVGEVDANSGAAAPASVNRSKILNALIYSKTAARDDANRVVLARATMKRRPEADGAT